jgi:hypothetical protein
MRALTVAPGPVEQRSVAFSEESVRLAGVIANLNQYSVAPLVARAAADLPASVVLPELDGRDGERAGGAVLDHRLGASALDQRSQTLRRRPTRCWRWSRRRRRPTTRSRRLTR